MHAGVDGDVPNAVDYVGEEDDKTGIHALLKADLFNLLCIPPPTLGRDVGQRWCCGRRRTASTGGPC